MSKYTKPTTASPDERVAIVATNKTEGAASGATASPLRKDLGAWLALGWQVVKEPAPAPETDAE